MVTTAGTGAVGLAPRGSVKVPASVSPAGVVNVMSCTVYGAFGCAE